ncbi:MAG TPA: hypothetical protein VJ837_04120 [Candidatus Paceibacterota bacterium]|nr:hypothetical protein [Candidatus Paceibacterota bacterium]
MIKVDEGHAALTTIARTYGQLALFDANEAETRLKVIDEIVFGVLGWQKADVNVEERVSEDGTTTFADYIIKTATTAILIEAKRVSAAFSLPTKKVRLRLGGVLSEGEVGEAIRQARDYCRIKAIPFAAVTNGSAWIVFPAARTDQVAFEDSDARVFRDLEEVTRRFVEFWELLSRERTLDGNLAHELLGRSARDLTPVNLRQLLPEPGYRLGRNALYEHLEPAISAALTDEALLENVEALGKCYVKTSERLKYDARLQVHLRDRIPPLGHTTVRVKSRRHERKAEAQITAAAPRGPLKFIVLLGTVGAGKTTFLHYTRKVSAAAAINGRVLWFLVDFKKATQADSPRQFILRELLNMIETDQEFELGDWHKSIRPAYSARIEALKRGPMYLLAKHDSQAFDRAVAHEIMTEREAVEPYVEAILRWASSKWAGFLVIDNVDQIDDLAQQESIFMEAQALARRAGLNVIMSLRESTFLRHRERPVFDAFEFDSFYVDPPNVRPVLAHRFNFAKKILEGTRVDLTTEQGMRVRVPDLSVFFDIVARSLLDEDTGLLIEALSGGNIRRGLALVREFLASGHTNADHAIATYLTDGSYRFPKHEFFRGAILGSFRYFNDSASLLPNLFDAKLAAPALQLLRLQIVSDLVDRATRGVTEGVLVSDLAAVCSRVGVPERDFLGVMQDLGRREMCRSIDGLPISVESSVVATRLGAYAIKEMCRDFTYADFCCVDASILDPASLQELQEITLDIEATHSPPERVALRATRIARFFDYLMRCEERWVVEAKRRELGEEWQGQVVKSVLQQAVLKDAETAQRSAERRFGRLPGPKPADTEAATQPVDAATYRGKIINSWPDKEYVFIRGEDGTDWFSHRRDFVSDKEWRKRKFDAKCLFLQGQWNGKPRATAVRVQR